MLIPKERIVVMKKLLSIILDTLIFLNIAIFLISIVYFFHGSFEMFPTEEQTEKIKIVTALFSILSFLAGTLFVKCRIKLGRRKQCAKSSN